jgi:hypothetical protein
MSCPPWNLGLSGAKHQTQLRFVFAHWSCELATVSFFIFLLWIDVGLKQAFDCAKTYRREFDCRRARLINIFLVIGLIQTQQAPHDAVIDKTLASG